MLNIIDSHFHIWNLDVLRLPWLKDCQLLLTAMPYQIFWQPMGATLMSISSAVSISKSIVMTGLKKMNTSMAFMNRRCWPKSCGLPFQHTCAYPSVSLVSANRSMYPVRLRAAACRKALSKDWKHWLMQGFSLKAATVRKNWMICIRQQKRFRRQNRHQPLWECDEVTPAYKSDD